jgi:hypothetical protein
MPSIARHGALRIDGKFVQIDVLVWNACLGQSVKPANEYF